MAGVESRRKFLDRNHNFILYLYPGVHTIYGPYLGKDGRYRVVLYDGSRNQTRQYCKLKMEVKLERRIEEPDTIDHDNRNTRDDRYQNLVVRNRSEHSSLDAKRRRRVLVSCKWCQQPFILRPTQVKNRAQNAAGPFCGKSCTGKYGASVQNGGRRLNRTVSKTTYYQHLKSTGVAKLVETRRI